MGRTVLLGFSRAAPWHSTAAALTDRGRDLRSGYPPDWQAPEHHPKCWRCTAFRTRLCRQTRWTPSLNVSSPTAAGPSHLKTVTPSRR